jgi:hypothetical protein
MFAWFCLLFMSEVSFAQLTENTAVDRAFVVRRALDSGLPRIRQLAHSGLLLHTTDGQFFLLEYMDDGKAYLTGVEIKTLETKADHKIVRMPGRTTGGTSDFLWTCQLNGKPLVGKEYTPKDIQRMMNELMNGRYDILNQEHCHAAQELVRKRLQIFD